MVLYSKLLYGSQFSEEKNSLEICFLVPEILNKYKRSIFFETPCIISLYFFINIKKIWKEDPDLIFFIWSLKYVFKFVLSLGTAEWNLISIFTFLFCILYTLIYTTLNSIVSNPIKVVVVIVVIVVVVLWKKKLGPKIFWFKYNPCLQNFKPKSVVSKKNLGKKKLGTNKFWNLF